MQVEISEAARDRLEGLVARGIYASVAEALEAAVWELPLDDAEVDWDAVAEKHQKGLRDIEAGRHRDVDEPFVNELRRRVGLPQH